MGLSYHADDSALWVEIQKEGMKMNISFGRPAARTWGLYCWLNRRQMSTIRNKKSSHFRNCLIFIVGAEGFEPPTLCL